MIEDSGKIIYNMSDALSKLRPNATFEMQEDNYSSITNYIDSKELPTEEELLKKVDSMNNPSIITKIFGK